MSTHARIAYIKEDGTVESIYVQFDGYVDGVGRILLENYTTTETISELIKLGDLSELNETPEKCESYFRNRGEVWNNVKPQSYSSLKNWLDEEDFLEYNYLYDPSEGEWFYKKGSYTKVFQPLNGADND